MAIDCERPPCIYAGNIERSRTSLGFNDIMESSLLGNRLNLVQEESPGSEGQRQSLTATGGNPRESATETKLPLYVYRGKGETSEVKAHSRLW